MANWVLVLIVVVAIALLAPAILFEGLQVLFLIAPLLLVIALAAFLIRRGNSRP